MSLKVVAGYHKGITGRTAVSGYDVANDYYKEAGCDLKIYQWPVTFEGTTVVAFWVNESYDSQDDEEEVIWRVKEKAEKLAMVYNKGLE